MKPFAHALRLLGRKALLLAALGPASLFAGTSLPSPQSETGFLAYLLINESPFPGERSYRSEADTMKAMDSILNVLIARLSQIPSNYRQSQVAAVTTDSLTDIITAGGIRGQVDGFYRDNAGRLKMESRVTQRVNHLLSIANDGPPGRFARLLDHAVRVADDYTRKSAAPEDLFAQLDKVEGVATTGRAYSWMTDQYTYHPGGNFVRIPDRLNGSLGGNRFFTLRRKPQ